MSSTSPSRDVLVGVKVIGCTIEPKTLPFSSASRLEVCPVAHDAGVPVAVKRLLHEPPVSPIAFHRIVRFMSDPDVGLAPMDWQYGGALGPAPPVWVGRSDGVEFHKEDYDAIDEFEDDMLDDGPRRVTPADWRTFARRYFDRVCADQDMSSMPIVVLESVFPTGCQVKVHGLGRVPDGTMGRAIGVYKTGGIGMVFPAPYDETPVLIRLENVEI